jgi:hypothetical protein
MDVPIAGWGRFQLHFSHIQMKKSALSVAGPIVLIVHKSDTELLRLGKQ